MSSLSDEHEPKCDVCNDTGEMYMCEDLYGPCMYCNLGDDEMEKFNNKCMEEAYERLKNEKLGVETELSELKVTNLNLTRDNDNLKKKVQAYDSIHRAVCGENIKLARELADLKKEMSQKSPFDDFELLKGAQDLNLRLYEEIEQLRDVIETQKMALCDI